MPFQESSSGVFVSTSPTVTIGHSEIQLVIEEAKKHDKRRARICAHQNVAAPVHEMVICLLQDGYIQPHCHRKFESLHVIEGRCDLVLFDPCGEVREAVALGNLADEKRYVRLEPQQFHTLIVRSEYFVFHETVQGPFRREDTLYADWAPAEQELEPRLAYSRILDESISKLRGSEDDA